MLYRNKSNRVQFDDSSKIVHTKFERYESLETEQVDIRTNDDMSSGTDNIEKLLTLQTKLPGRSKQFIFQLWRGQPFGMKNAFPVETFVCVCAEVITLGLYHIGAKSFSAVAVVVIQS